MMAKDKKGEEFDLLDGMDFDLLALRSFRREARIKYSNLNQSEPLRIYLSALVTFFALSYPKIAAALQDPVSLSAACPSCPRASRDRAYDSQSSPHPHSHLHVVTQSLPQRMQRSERASYAFPPPPVALTSRLPPGRSPTSSACSAS